MERIACGPNRVPGRCEVPPSKGAPITTTSASAKVEGSSRVQRGTPRKVTSGPNIAPYRSLITAVWSGARGSVTHHRHAQGELAVTHELSRGGNIGLAQAGLAGGPVVVTLTWVPVAGVDADLSAFLVGADGKVRSDADFVFYNQPEGADGAVRHLGKQQDGGRTVDRAQVDVAALPADVERVVIGASLDGGGTFGSLSGLAVEVGAPGAAAGGALRARRDGRDGDGVRRGVPAGR